MKVIRGIEKLQKDSLKKPTAVAIGTFDGMHKGHAAIIKKAVKLARKKNHIRLVLTFSPHPRQITQKEKKPVLLTSLDHRIKLIKKLKPDICLVVAFTKKFAQLTPKQFVKNIIKNKLNAAEVIVGEKFNFGRKHSGNSRLLGQYAKKMNFNVFVVPPLKNGHHIISSSLIRKLVEEGSLAQAGRLLGRKFSILGTVIKGDSRGRRLGFPTANIDPHQEALPPPGVYAIKIRLNERFYDGMLYIGYRATFYRNEKKTVVEVNIFNFNKKLYGRELELVFIKKIRNDKHFKTQGLLIKQIKRDKQSALRMLRKLAKSFGINHFL